MSGRRTPGTEIDRLPAIAVEQSRSSSLRYRPDIDGLRAVAVLAVVFYHAFPRLIPGGFVGVDIFFVISGFLITGIIDQQLREGRFSVADFYARRIRRIFPALIVVVLATFAAGWFLLPMREMESLGASIAGGALFAENFVLLGQVGYFDLIADKKPLLHLWSLGIEEQYYILWPAALLLVRRWKWNATATVVTLAIASFVLCIGVRRYVSADAAFYLPFTRAWELFAGAAITLWQKEKPPTEPITQRGWWLREAVAAATIFAFAYAFWRFGVHTSYPGANTLIPVVASGILLGTRRTMVHRLLATRRAVVVGLISYSLYLWHFPLMAFTRIHFVDGVAWWMKLTMIAAAFLLAWLTYRFIEGPVRFGKKLMGLKVAGLVTAMACLAVVGIAADETGGLPVRFPSSIRGFLLARDETRPYWRLQQCLLFTEQDGSDFIPECAGEGRHPLVLVWGDSYAAALYTGLKSVAEEKGYSVAQYTSSACPPMLDFFVPERPLCQVTNDFVIKKIAELKPEEVILYSTWKYDPKYFRPGVTKTVAALHALSIKKIVLMGPPPGWLGSGLPSNMLDYYFDTGLLLPERTFYRSDDAWTKPMDTLQAQLARELGIEYVSARDIFCNADGCLTRIGPNGQDIATFDTGHLTVPGAIFAVEQAQNTLFDFDR